MKYVRIPSARVGALIGPGGKTKKKLEELSGCEISIDSDDGLVEICLLYTSPSPRDRQKSRMPSSA